MQIEIHGRYEGFLQTGQFRQKPQREDVYPCVLNNSTDDEPFHRIAYPIRFKIQPFIDNRLSVCICAGRMTEADYGILLHRVGEESQILLGEALAQEDASLHRRHFADGISQHQRVDQRIANASIR